MPQKDLHKILGIKKTATKGEIKSAFRSKAKSTHPDKNGKQNEFSDVNLAYRILSDDKKRLVYEATGTYEERAEDQTENQARELFLTIFNELINTENILTLHLFDEVKERLLATREHNKKVVVILTGKISKLEKVRKKIKSNHDKSSDPVFTLIDQQIKQIRVAILNTEVTIKHTELALTLCNNYSFDNDKEDLSQFTINPIQLNPFARPFRF